MRATFIEANPLSRIHKEKLGWGLSTVPASGEISASVLGRGVWAAHQSICYRKPVEDFEQGSDMTEIMFLRFKLAAVLRNYCGSRSRSRETSETVCGHFGLLALYCLENQPGRVWSLVGIQSSFLVNHIRESEQLLVNSIYSFNTSENVCRRLHGSREA